MAVCPEHRIHQKIHNLPEILSLQVRGHLRDLAVRRLGDLIETVHGK